MNTKNIPDESIEDNKKYLILKRLNSFLTSLENINSSSEKFKMDKFWLSKLIELYTNDTLYLTKEDLYIVNKMYREYQDEI